MDLVEEDEHFVLRADLPGVAASSEPSGQFAHSLTLPEGIDPDSIQAHFEKGVLELRVPKPERRKPRRVAINVAGGQSTIEGEAQPGA
jgi:HSP20 family protein